MCWRWRLHSRLLTRIDYSKHQIIIIITIINISPVMRISNLPLVVVAIVIVVVVVAVVVVVVVVVVVDPSIRKYT